MFVPPKAADLERNILSHYSLQDPFPTEWPAELDESDDEDIQKVGVRRSKSRYSALERAASDRRTFLPGSQQTRDGKANLVQKDEPDPLGAQGTVINSLRSRELPIDQDIRMRNKFLLSSTTFSPATFLAVTHSEDSTDDLIRGLQFLSRSIDQKSASLKVLVETNFERFVRAKATIDNVYTEMRNQGIDTTANRGPPSPRTNRHSRQFSRNSGFHQRITSSGSAAPPQQPSKNALRKETEYGTQGVKGPLLEVSQRADDVWGPALGGREREASLKAVVEAIEKDRSLYELGSELSSAILQRNYERVVELYNAARSYATDATALGERAAGTGQTLNDEQIHKLLVTGRMWGDVQEQVKLLKRDIWKRLSNLDAAQTGPALGQAEEHMELIGVLLELGVDDNPVWVWLLSRYDLLKRKIAAVTERSKVEIEILRRHLAAAERTSPEVAASFLRSATNDAPEQPDADQVVEFWKTVSAYLTKLLSLTGGLLAEVIDFWDAAKSFIDGSKQNSLPAGYDGESRKHHRLSDAGVRDLSNGTVELVNMIRDAVYSLFAESPTEDISSIISPVPDSANGNMTPKDPMSPLFSPSAGRLASIDMVNIPPPSPRVGDPWEDLAFWPPHSNALSAVQYLTSMLVLVGAGAGEIATLDPVARNASVHEKLRSMVNAVRERCLRAVCTAWAKDISNTKHLEDWLRSSEVNNQTRLPLYFTSYIKAVVNGVQQIVYLSEATAKPAARNLVTPPPSKMVQMVRSHFAQGILTALKGMQESAENAVKSDEDEWVMVSNALGSTNLDGSSEVASYKVDASNRNVRILLTLSNLKALRTEYTPQLIQQFESSFSVKLTDETKQINDKYGQTDTELFHSYTRPTITHLTKVIKEGINKPTWEPKTTQPDQVSPYVYAALMILVNIHTEVSTTVMNSGTSNTSLLNEILSYLLENISRALLDGFKERKPNRYTLAALIQATLDTEFIAQTMSQYASKRVGEIQNEIYVELDKRTTNEARADLQKELGVMRGILKKLRENSRNSFGCFKRPKSDKEKSVVKK